MVRELLAPILVLSACACSSSSPLFFGQSGGGTIGDDACTDRDGVLVYGPTDMADSVLLGELGLDVTTWDEDEWSAATTDDFAEFDLIVVGEEACTGPDENGSLGALMDSSEAWGPAVDGRVIVSGLDVVCHSVDWESFNGGDETVPPLLYANSMSWLTEGCGTAAYFATDWGHWEAAHLAPLGEWEEYETRGDTVTLLEPDHALFEGIADDGLDRWGASYHTVFSTHPDDFRAVAEGEGDGPIILLRAADAG